MEKTNQERGKTYWEQRALQIEIRQAKKADRVQEEIEKLYMKALSSIQRNIESFYIRYAEAEEIDYATAKRNLSNAEKEVWEVDLEEYRRMALDETFINEIESMYSKSRISRLQALQSQIRAQIEILNKRGEELTSELLADTFTDTYYRTVYEIQKGVGIGSNFARYNQDAVDIIIQQPWKGSNFSNRWGTDKTKLLSELEVALTHAFIRGDSIDKTIDVVAKKMKRSKDWAANVVQTESAFIAGEATARGYKETGIEKYEFLATLDFKTSEICIDLDGLPFELKDKKVAVNYPPMHCFCRSTTVPLIEDIEDYGERIARRSDGKSYYVPESMKYKEWYKEYVANNPEELLAAKKLKNKASDKKQYGRYKEVLGKDTPKDFDKFQELKYNNDKGWDEVKELYKDVNWQKEALKNIQKGSEHQVPFIHNPNSVFDNYKNGKLESRRYYGKTGKPRLDIDLTDHGNSKQHRVVPHQHNWLKDENDHDKIQRPKDLPITKAQKIANKDILEGSE